jgi:predicted RND superfamily exporter protein
VSDSTASAQLSKRKPYAYGEWVVRNRWWVILASLLSVAAIGYGLSQVNISRDLRIYFADDNPQYNIYEAIENTYVRNDNMLYALAPKDGNVFTRETLAVLEKLTEDSWQMPHSLRVDSITNYQWSRANGDDLIVTDLVENAAELTDEDLVRIREVAMSEPLLVNGLVSDRGHVASVNITILKRGATGVVGNVMRHVDQTLAQLEKDHPEIDIYTAGSIPTDMTFGIAAFQEFESLWPMAFLVIFIVLGICLRAVFGTVLAMLGIFMTAIVAVGATGWIGMPLNPTTIKAPVLLLSLAVAHSVHILVTLYQEMQRGRSRRDAVIESLRINMQPVAITSLTTAIGFLALNFSDAPPFRELGNIVAFGMIAAFAYSVTFVPAMMAVLPVRVRQRSPTHLPLMDRFASFVIGYKAPIFWGMSVVIVVVSSGMMRIELDDNFIEYFDHRYEFRRNADFVQENLTGLNVIEYSLSAGEEGGISRPDYLAKLDAFTQWYRQQPTVVNVNSISEVFKRLNKNMHGDEPEWHRVPEDRELAAQYLLLYELSLPYGLDLNNQINVGKSATRFIVVLRDQTSRGLQEIDRKAQAWLAQNAPDLEVPGSGIAIVVAGLSERNINSMLFGSVLALVLISMILILALRSVKIGLISLVPNLFPVAMAFGVWGVLVSEVGLAIATVVAMTLGIVVDDTVHFLSKYLRARREHGMDAPEAVRYSFNTVGSALLITTVVLVLGFCVLGTSGYRPSSHVGWLSSITIMVALIADFLFLPTLLIYLDRKTKRIN